MHILYLHQYFCPPDGAGGTRSYEMAKRLIKAGHKVSFVTTSAFFPNKYQFHEETKIEIDGIELIVCNIPYNNSMNFYQRSGAFIKFIFKGTIACFKIKRFDVVLATSTPLTIFIPGFIASRICRVPLIFEVRDLWPDLPIAIGAIKNPILKWLLKLVEKSAYNASKSIIALSPGIKETIVKTGIPKNKITTIQNGCDIKLFQPNASKIESFFSKYPQFLSAPLVVYTGTLGEINNVGYIVDLAAGMLRKHYNVNFLICGTGSEENKIREKAIKLGVINANLWMIPPIPKKNMGTVLGASTVAISVFQNLPEMQNNSANKFFDALSAGKPIIINYGGWQASLLEEHKAGLVLPSSDIESSCKKLFSFLNNENALNYASKQAKELAYKKFDRDKQSMLFLSVIENVNNSHLNS